MSVASGMLRSTSSHHLISPAASSPGSALAHYGSAIDTATATSPTPHLSHLRQSSSVGMHHHIHHHHEEHYPTSAEGYDVYEEIGVGAFATVYHAVIKGTGENVAVKVIDLDQFNTNWEEVRREILVMSLASHPNVVRILTSFVEQQDLWIILPLLEGGSCAHIMKTIYPTGMKDEAMVATILHEVLEGLLYFHKDGRLHRDLKAGNVLISAHGDVQLADFGVAGTLMENGDRKKARRTFTGTPCWMAPEVMEHNENGYDEKADIWSFGITALELAYGRAPYAKFPPMKVMVLTLQEDPPTAEVYKDHSYEFSKHFHSMVAKCLRKDPTKRPNVQKLLEHKFFKAAKNKQYLIDKIIKKMPVKRMPANPKLLNLCELRHSTMNGNGDDDGIKEKPVSVGSWVFDKAEFDEMKRQVLEAKESEGSEGARHASVQASYEDDTPKSGMQLGRLSISDMPKPILKTTPPGAEESGSDDPEDDPLDPDEESRRPLPDFTDPNPYAGLPQPRSRSQAVSTTSPPLTNSNPTSGATSPGEHQEGRFRVCDDEDQDDGQERFVHEGNVVYPQGGIHPSHSNYYDNTGSIGRTSDLDVHRSATFPEFHNDAFDPYDENAAIEDQGQHHETHVGRFAVMDDEDQ